VAASNSLDVVNADYICDGTADEGYVPGHPQTKE
jgi:hypothetical protein